jgi:hypothetical protein
MSACASPAQSKKPVTPSGVLQTARLVTCPPSAPNLANGPGCSLACLGKACSRPETSCQRRRKTARHYREIRATMALRPHASLRCARWTNSRGVRQWPQEMESSLPHRAQIAGWAGERRRAMAVPSIPPDRDASVAEASPAISHPSPSASPPVVAAHFLGWRPRGVRMQRALSMCKTGCRCLLASRWSAFCQTTRIA